MFVLWISFFIIFWLYYRISNRHVYNAVRNFVGTGKTLPVVGDFHLILGKDVNGIVSWVLEVFKGSSRTGKLWFMTKLIVVPTKPEDIQTVLTSRHCLTKPPIYDATPGAKYALVTTKPNIWKPVRRALDPSFNRHIVKQTFPKLKEASELLVQELKSYVGQGEFNLKEPLLLRIIDSSLRSSYDFCVDDINKLKQIRAEITIGLKKTEQRLRIYLIFSFLIQFEKRMKQPAKMTYKGLKEVLDQAVSNLIKRQFNDEVEAKHQSDSRSANFFHSLYNLLKTNVISTLEFEDILITTFVNGIDTTAIIIGNVIMCLALFPEIQEKLFKEVNENLDMQTENDYDTVNGLEYLDCVLKESLRFLPSAPVFSRIATNDIVLSDGIIPSGTEIFILADNVHKNKEIWSVNADKFDPDNFLPGSCKKRHPCSFIPFSYGPRNCIGSRLALAIVKDFITKLVLSYKFSTKLRVDDLEFVRSLTSQLKSTYLISIEERKSTYHIPYLPQPHKHGQYAKKI